MLEGARNSQVLKHAGIILELTFYLLDANVRNFPGMEEPNFKSYFSVMENLPKSLSASSDS